MDIPRDDGAIKFEGQADLRLKLLAQLKTELAERNPIFWSTLEKTSRLTDRFSELLPLFNLRKKAWHSGLKDPRVNTKSLRLAIVGGYSLFPLQEIIAHTFTVQGTPIELFTGDYDNYNSEIFSPTSPLYEAKPDVVFLIPAGRRCFYTGKITDPVEQVMASAQAQAEEILNLAKKIHSICQAEVILANFRLPSHFDLGPYRTRSLATDWNFKKQVNLLMGLNAPAFVHICDQEFLANRMGGLKIDDPQAWFESKQLGSPDYLVSLAREFFQVTSSLYQPMKKVLVLDLDNTLWGGVIGDDGIEKIDIGGVSPRGEAFRDFQSYIKTLKDRGVVLAVCSKNDLDKAQEPFIKHPEMALRLEDFVSFQANWNPKSDNIKLIADELNLGLSSFVFADDNPAEIEIVRKFAPDVTCLLLDGDPSGFTTVLKDSRLFEPRNITNEDFGKTALYQKETERRELETSITDMPTFLKSLEMEAQIRPFNRVDAPRISQLINKSNQFNLTTFRKTEAEVLHLAEDPQFRSFTVRLKDKFGDHGLISVFLGQIEGRILNIELWLMSCRVLKRQVEEIFMNEVVAIAKVSNCDRIQGRYIPTAKNGMVKDLLPKFGFSLAKETPSQTEYFLDISSYKAYETFVKRV